MADHKGCVRDRSGDVKAWTSAWMGDSEAVLVDKEDDTSKSVFFDLSTAKVFS